MDLVPANTEVVQYIFSSFLGAHLEHQKLLQQRWKCLPRKLQPGTIAIKTFWCSAQPQMVETVRLHIDHFVWMCKLIE